MYMVNLSVCQPI